MSQDLRNKLYAGASAVLTLLLVGGVVTVADQDQILDFTEQAIGLASSVIGLSASVMAWWKSRPKTTTTVDVPREKVRIVDVE